MDLSQIATVVSLLAVAASFVYACVRVGLVAGRADSRMETLSHGLARLTESLQAFADKADERLNVHGEELAAHRVEIAAIKTALHGRQGGA